MERLAPISNAHGRPLRKPPGSKGCAFTIFAIASLLSALAEGLGSPSSAGFWAMQRLRRPRNTRISTLTRRGAPSIKWGARSAPQCAGSPVRKSYPLRRADRASRLQKHARIGRRADKPGCITRFPCVLLVLAGDARDDETS